VVDVTLPEFLLARFDDPKPDNASPMWEQDRAGRRWLVKTAIAARQAGTLTGAADAGVERLMRLMATAHADHPDYRAEWRVE
jgi:hypothetical protein